jgi:hypothetical protein
MSTRLWGGRFSKDVSNDVKEWTDSTLVDMQMVDEDLWGSMAHVTMLSMQKIIPASDATQILRELLVLQDAYHKGEFKLNAEQDDVHMVGFFGFLKTNQIDMAINFKLRIKFKSTISFLYHHRMSKLKSSKQLESKLEEKCTPLALATTKSFSTAK